MKKTLIEIFRETNYQSRKNGMTANLATQFTDYALEQIVEHFIDKGIVASPCKIGQKIWYIDKNKKIQEAEVVCIDIRATSKHIIATRYVWETEETVKLALMFDRLNEDYWLTKEQANKVLREMKK